MMMNNDNLNGIRLPSIIPPYHQHPQPQPHTHFTIPGDLPMFQHQHQQQPQHQQQQQQQQQQPYPTQWAPTHTKSYSLDSVPSHHQPAKFKPIHSKSKSLNHQPLNNYEVNYPIQQIPMEKLSSIPLEDLNKIPKLADLATKKYSTSIDERSFVTVYEYQIENNWIIWDYHTGLVHLTGLWKSIGNKKADIVKLIDSSPELVDIVKRVRGGFLKIQGTWIPYDIARRLACKFCHKIRYSLIPLFGYDFVNDCLKPDQAGFGLLRLDNVTSNSNRQHMKRVKKLQQLQLHQLQLQQLQQLQQIPMTPYYYYQQQQQQQLPTPTSSVSSSASSSIGYNLFQPTLLSPLEPYADQMLNLPKLHTFTNINNASSNFLQSLNNRPQYTDNDSISPKSSISSTSNTPSHQQQLKNIKKNRDGIHKKSKSASSINLNTVLKLAIKLDGYNEKQDGQRDYYDEGEDDDDERDVERADPAEQFYGYDKSVIDAASSLMFVSNSWRSNNNNNQQSALVALHSPDEQRNVEVVKEEGKRKSRMDISGLLS